MVTVERFTTEDEAIRLGNDTDYGLAGRCGPPTPRAQRVAGRLRHGTVWINEYNRYLPQAEVGRLQAVGHWARARPDRARRVPRGQAHLPEHGTCPDRLVLGE